MLDTTIGHNPSDVVDPEIEEIVWNIDINRVRPHTGPVVQPLGDGVEELTACLAGVSGVRLFLSGMSAIRI